MQSIPLVMVCWYQRQTARPPCRSRLESDHAAAACVDTMICNKQPWELVQLAGAGATRPQCGSLKQVPHLVDWNEDELDEEAQQAYCQKAQCCQPSHLPELPPVGLLAALQQSAGSSAMIVITHPWATLLCAP